MKTKRHLKILEIKMNMKKEWKCQICSTIFDTKRELKEDTVSHIEESSFDLDLAVSQADWLGIKEKEYQ